MVIRQPTFLQEHTSDTSWTSLARALDALGLKRVKVYGRLRRERKHVLTCIKGTLPDTA